MWRCSTLLQLKINAKKDSHDQLRSELAIAATLTPASDILEIPTPTPALKQQLPSRLP